MSTTLFDRASRIIQQTSTSSDSKTKAFLLLLFFVKEFIMSQQSDPIAAKRVVVDGFGAVLIERRGRKGIFSASFRHDGKHKRKSLNTTDWDQAAARLPNILDQVTGYRESLECDIGFSAGLEAYVDYLVSNNRPKRTVSQVRTRIGVFFEFLDRHSIKSFSQIRRIHADQFRTFLLQSRSQSTAFGYFRMARSMIRYLVSRNLVAKDPFEGIHYKRPEFRHAVIPTLKQVIRILDTVRDRYLVPISALAFLGCRRDELAGILAANVDLQSRKIFICKPSGVSSKTVSREIPIHLRLGNLLKDFSRPRSKFFFCTLPSCRSKGGKRLKTDFLNDEFKRAASSVGYPVGKNVQGGMTLHSLRGFFKSHALLSGVPREVVDTWQGHRNDRSASFTHYFNLPWSKSCQWMDAIEFGPATTNEYQHQTFTPVTNRAVYYA